MRLPKAPKVQMPKAGAGMPKPKGTKAPKMAGGSLPVPKSIAPRK